MLQTPSRLFKDKDLHAIMEACIILHNMIVEDERGLDLPLSYKPHSSPPPSSRQNVSFGEFVAKFFEIRDADTHDQLQSDLIEHLWQRRGDM